MGLETESFSSSNTCHTGTGQTEVYPISKTRNMRTPNLIKSQYNTIPNLTFYTIIKIYAHTEDMALLIRDICFENGAAVKVVVGGRRCGRRLVAAEVVVDAAPLWAEGQVKLFRVIFPRKE